MIALEARDVRVTYGETVALSGVDLRLDSGRHLALMGSSGSGKSTLLHCLAGVVVPDSGRVLLDGHDFASISEKGRSRSRLEHIGVVFQFGDLVPELTLVENVALPLLLLGHDRSTATKRAVALLDELGIADVAKQRAGAVSGGQAQRAAVARALVHEPRVVLADEPTGSLDSVTSEAVLDAMTTLARRIDAALLVVTHDHVVASHLDELVTMRDGRIELAVAGR